MKKIVLCVVLSCASCFCNHIVRIYAPNFEEFRGEVDGYMWKKVVNGDRLLVNGKLSDIFQNVDRKLFGIVRDYMKKDNAGVLQAKVVCNEDCIFLFSAGTIECKKLSGFNGAMDAMYTVDTRTIDMPEGVYVADKSANNVEYWTLAVGTERGKVYGARGEEGEKKILDAAREKSGMYEVIQLEDKSKHFVWKSVVSHWLSYSGYLQKEEWCVRFKSVRKKYLEVASVENIVGEWDMGLGDKLEREILRDDWECLYGMLQYYEHRMLNMMQLYEQ